MWSSLAEKDTQSAAKLDIERQWLCSFDRKWTGRKFLRADLTPSTTNAEFIQFTTHVQVNNLSKQVSNLIVTENHTKPAQPHLLSLLLPTPAPRTAAPIKGAADRRWDCCCCSRRVTLVPKNFKCSEIMKSLTTGAAAAGCSM
jgi:hypothetical protein